MPLTISDEDLKQAGVTEREARLELALRLFDVGKLSLWPAAQFAGMSRAEFEGELFARGISAYRPTLQDVANDAAAIERLKQAGR